MGIISASYTGATIVKACVFTDVIGTSPAVAILDLVPQESLPADFGTLVLTDGLQTITVPNCVLDRGSIRYRRSDGFVQQVQIRDRREFWKFPAVWGTYNVKHPDGTVIPETEKTPQELMSLLLDAIGETGYDVSDMPNDARPFIYWECTNALSQINWLLEQTSCSIAFNRTTDSVVVVELGVGSVLPVGPVQTVSYGVDVGNHPDRINAYAGQTLFQSKLKLAARALDVDGKYKAFDDPDLSYGEEGWPESETNPNRLLEDNEDENIRALANESVYIAFEIVSQADGSQDIPGYDDNPIDDISLILPVRSRLADATTRPDGSLFEYPAYIEGVFVPGGEPEALENTEPGARLEVGFSIDEENGMVFLDRKVVKLNDDGDGFEAPELYLCTSYGLRDADSWAWYSYRRFVTLDTNGIPDWDIDRRDIQKRIIAEYDDPDDPTLVTGVDDNEAEVDGSLDQTLLDAIGDVTPVESEAARYVGIIGTQLDGALRQATYIVKDRTYGEMAGAFTFVVRNTESEPGMATKREQARNSHLDGQRHRQLNVMVGDYQRSRAK